MTRVSPTVMSLFKGLSMSEISSLLKVSLILYLILLKSSLDMEPNMSMDSLPRTALVVMSLR